jgi:4a-hydroxytetrahydrobiopterin dehydratase
MAMDSLLEQHCKPLQDKSCCLDDTAVDSYLQQVPGWSVNSKGGLNKHFKFKNFHETVAFINAMAWIANSEDHHPDIEAGYNNCKLTFKTHSIGCISVNDFICAAKVNALVND